MDDANVTLPGTVGDVLPRTWTPRPRLLRHVRLSPVLVIGLVLVLGPLVAAAIARLFVSRHGLQIFASDPSHAPTRHNLLGTDSSGRDVLASVVYGTPPTYELGLIAGAAGTAIGTVCGLVAGYYGRALDTLVRGLGDVLLGIPAFALLIVIAAVMGAPSIEGLGLIIAALSWPLPARAIRSQVLALREQPFVVVARLSNRSGPGIIFAEILPNVLALVSAILVGAVSGALLIAIGLQLLGLGPVGVPTLGLTLQTAISGGALSQGLWWWWASPTVLLVLLFLGLFCTSLAVDEIANPRLRREVARG
jgi:peptide/nickel transport system permease protein